MSRISCVRSMTFRSSARSRLRSCAGLSSLSNMTTSIDASSHAVASDVDLAAAEEGGRIGLGPLLQHAKADLRARRCREPAELVERMFGIEMSLGVLEEADERRPFPRHPSDLITRSHGIAPSRISRSEPSRTSTIVDGAPPRVTPPSITQSTSGSASSTSLAATAGRSPDRLALVDGDAVTERSGERAGNRMVRHAHADCRATRQQIASDF